MAGLKSVMAGLVPSSLFGRLAMLLILAVVSSHLLALTLMFELRPEHPEWGQHFPPDPHHPQGPPPFTLLLDIAVRLAALTLAAWIGARWLADPVRKLADAARELGRDIHRAPLPEQGTTECREATRVFNQMQTQIREQLQQRDQFVAAVSHDLRTPLTRLALRAQSLKDAEQRQHFDKDIAEMDAMIRATLDYLRGAAEAEPVVRLDVGSLLFSMASDWQDTGHDVAVEGEVPHVAVMAQTSTLRRCLDNLIENAVRYGRQGRIALEANGIAVHIHVRDTGPGIPDGELAKVLAPFYRLEGSRNRSSGGVGLGLASAHDIALRHGGSLQLRNGVLGGLCATVTLPATAVSASKVK